MADRLPTLPAALAWAAAQDRPGAGLRFLDAAEHETFLSWPEVHRRARASAGSLRSMGVKPGDLVAIVLPTSPGFFDAFFGLSLLGAVPVPLYPPVRLGRLDEYITRTSAMIRQVGASMILSDARVGRMLGEVVAKVRPRDGFHDVRGLATGPEMDLPVAPDDLGLVQFSSGTTVDAKPVALTHRALLANAYAVTDVVVAANPVHGAVPAAGVTWLPLYHDMGLVGCVLPAMLAPGPLTLIPPELFLARPALWLRAISRYRGTVSPAPDFAYALCTERIRDDELEGIDLSSWSLALNGAEPIAPATLAAFAARFAPYGLDPKALTPVYGLSEMALAVTFSPTGRGPRILHLDADALTADRAVLQPGGAPRVSVGAPLPGYAVRILANGEPAPEGHVGHVQVSGPSRMKGYVGRTDVPFDGPWLDTGDKGFLLDGELVITGRAKDLIVHRGRNHAPQDLEQAVSAVEGVRTGCVVAVGDVGDAGEQVLVFAEVREPREGLAEAAVAAVRAATGIQPDLVLLLDPGTLPRTSSGKLRRSETLLRWREGTLTPPDAVTPVRLAGALARSFVGRMRARWT